MVEMTTSSSFNKLRQKRLKAYSNRLKGKSTKGFLPNKGELYTKEEFELLDTIYSDGPQIRQSFSEHTSIENFWPEKKEEYLSFPEKKTNILSNTGWFLGGIVLSSVIWLIYSQVSIGQMKSKADTQIVFQTSTSIMTEKNIDKEVRKQLSRNAKINGSGFGLLSKFFGNKTKTINKPEQKTEQAPVLNGQVEKPEKKDLQQPQAQIPTSSIRHHIVANGDSLWLIANKYYANPSPQNIQKIMKANNMRRVGLLSLGQKLIIPE